MKKIIYPILASVMAVSAFVHADEVKVVVENSPGFHFYPKYKGALGYLPNDNEIIYGSNGTDKLPLRPFTKWKSTHRGPLTILKDYQEPNIVVKDKTDQSESAHLKELEVFEARFAFVINKSFDKVTQDKVMNKKMLQAIDPAIAFSDLSPTGIEETGDPITDSQPWCKGANQLCVKAVITFSDFVRDSISSAYKAENRENPPESITYESELNWLEGDSAADFVVTPSDIKVMNQKIFYIDHYFQYGVTNIVFQRLEGNKTLVVGMVALGIQKDFLDMGKDKLDKIKEKTGGTLQLSMRKLVTEGSGGDALLGLKGIEVGLIPYTQEKAKALLNYLNKNI